MIQVGTMFNTPLPPAASQGMNAGATTNATYSHQFQPIQFKPFKPPDGEFDGKRLRKSVMRKTVDYNSSVVQLLEARIWQKDERLRPSLPPDICFASQILPPPAYLQNPINAVVTKFVRTSTNKAKCPIFCLAWTPEGRRLITGASSGEFTLWNGLTFNFETILQAHESSVRAMVWSHNDQWMVTGDTSGYVKYWQSNMNNVKMFQAHKDPVRGLSFSPSDQKIATGSDDGTVRIWDFFRCQEERVLRGHGADVKCVDWHPSKSLLASGSKDNQQPIKLWDPRSGSSLAKLHAHKSTVMDLKWNGNGNWLCSASRDHLLKLFDIRNFSTELQIFRGHKKEASSIAWHPQHEGLFASGGSDGSILFWHVGNDKEVGAIESAHDGIIWDLAWHPLGHLLCSGSNDHTSKFWTRNRPGDKMRDKYNLNTLPPGVVGDDCVDIDDIPVSASYVVAASIPGMGPDDKVEAEPETKAPETIPGLDFDSIVFDSKFLKKTPYAKPIPKTFQAAWNAAGGLDEDVEDDQTNNWVIVESASLFSKPAQIEGAPVRTLIGEELPPGSVHLSEITANAIAYFGFYIPLPPVTGDAVADAFAFYDEEEAISKLTSDPEFARKLIREKRGLYNPTINQGDDSKQEDRTDRKHSGYQKDSQRGGRSNRTGGSFHTSNNYGGRNQSEGFNDEKNNIGSLGGRSSLLPTPNPQSNNFPQNNVNNFNMQNQNMPLPFNVPNMPGLNIANMPNLNLPNLNLNMANMQGGPLDLLRLVGSLRGFSSQNVQSQDSRDRDFRGDNRDRGFRDRGDQWNNDFDRDGDRGFRNNRDRGFSNKNRDDRDMRERGDRDFRDRGNRDFRDRGDRDYQDRDDRDFRDRGDRNFRERGDRSFRDGGDRDFRDRGDRDFRDKGDRKSRWENKGRGGGKRAWNKGNNVGDGDDQCDVEDGNNDRRWRDREDDSFQGSGGKRRNRGGKRGGRGKGRSKGNRRDGGPNNNFDSSYI